MMWHIKKDDGKSIIMESLKAAKKRGNGYIVHINTIDNMYTVSEDDTLIIGSEAIFIGKCTSDYIWTFILNMNQIESVKIKENRNPKEK